MKTLSHLLGLLSLMSTLPAPAEIKETAVEYVSGGVTCEGWHAYDTAKEGKRPAVLVVHQWTGVSDYEKMRARMLAELGYNVFVADIYGKGIRPQPPAAGQEAGKYKGDRKLYRERLTSGLEVLNKDLRTDTTKVAVIGYCFGGTGALELARSGADVKAAVSFHGSLSSPTPDDATKIKGQVLALHGADDPFVPGGEVEAFHSEMKVAGVKYKFVAYPGAVHSFTQKAAGDDVSKGAAYNAEADTKSWEAMKELFATALK
ncbi:MAG: dienelactone hydrolase family protein [Verrucomicrobium sp.]